MRFHKFKTKQGAGVWVNLDQVEAVYPAGSIEERCNIHTIGASFQVQHAADEVMALISPRAAPDTYEQELAQAKAGHADAKYARIDECYRTARILLGDHPLYWPQWAKDVIEARVSQISGEAPAEADAVPEVSILPADEARSLGIAAGRAELMLLWKWMEDREMAIFGHGDIRSYIRERLNGFEKGEV